MSKTWFFRNSLFVAVFLLLPTLNASAEEWKGRFLGQWISSSASIFADEDSTSIFGDGDFDNGFGAYVGVERRLSDRWGVELGVGWSELESSQTTIIDIFGFSISSGLETSLQWVPVTAAANIHLTPQNRADLYIAPRVGWAFLDDLEVVTVVDVDGFPTLPGFPGVFLPGIDGTAQTTSLPTDDTFIYGARLGLDWPVGDAGWNVSGTVDYTVMELEIGNLEGIDIDPLMVGFGFSKHW